jgi:hypothetical protein
MSKISIGAGGKILLAGREQDARKYLIIKIIDE